MWLGARKISFGTIATSLPSPHRSPRISSVGQRNNWVKQTFSVIQNCCSCITTTNALLGNLCNFGIKAANHPTLWSYLKNYSFQPPEVLCSLSVDAICNVWEESLLGHRTCSQRDKRGCHPTSKLKWFFHFLWSTEGDNRMQTILHR